VDIIQEFGTTVTVTRPASGGSYIDGKWVPATTSTTFSVVASIQPMKPFETALLPEGYRNRESVRIYSDTFIKIGDHSTPALTRGDTFPWNNGTYEIMSVETFNGPDGFLPDLPHFKGIAFLRTLDENKK
jgi:hypothetical protein